MSNKKYLEDYTYNTAYEDGVVIVSHVVMKFESKIVRAYERRQGWNHHEANIFPNYWEDYSCDYGG